MNSDEQAIRQLVAKWMSASKSGDLETVLSLMTDDAVFLVTGQLPMSKADFATAMRAQTAAPAIDGSSDIQEIEIMGDWAFMRSALRVVVTPPNAKSIIRAGHTLSILRKQQGRWLLARDANMLVTLQS